MEYLGIVKPRVDDTLDQQAAKGLVMSTELVVSSTVSTEVERITSGPMVRPTELEVRVDAPPLPSGIEREAQTIDFLGNFSEALDILGNKKVPGAIDTLLTSISEVSGVVELIDTGFDERAEKFVAKYEDSDEYGGMIQEILRLVLSFSEAQDKWFDQHIATRNDLLSEAGELNTHLHALRERFEDLAIRQEEIRANVTNKEVDAIRLMEKIAEANKQLHTAIAQRDKLGADADSVGEEIYLTQREQSIANDAKVNYDAKIKESKARYMETEKKGFEYRTEVIPSLEREMRALSADLFTIGRSTASIVVGEWQELQAEVGDLLKQIHDTMRDIAELRGRVGDNLAAEFPQLPTLLRDDSALLAIIGRNPTRNLQVLRRQTPDQLGAEVAKDPIASAAAVKAMGAEVIVSAARRSGTYGDLLEKVFGSSEAANHDDTTLKTIAERNGIDFPPGTDILTALKGMANVLKIRELRQSESVPTHDGTPDQPPASLGGGHVSMIDRLLGKA